MLGRAVTPLEGHGPREWACLERALVVRDTFAGGERTFLTTEDAQAFRAHIYAQHGAQPCAQPCSPLPRQRAADLGNRMSTGLISAHEKPWLHAALLHARRPSSHANLHPQHAWCCASFASPALQKRTCEQSLLRRTAELVHAGLPPPAPRHPLPRVITFQRKRANRRVINEAGLLELLAQFGEVRACTSARHRGRNGACPTPARLHAQQEGLHGR